MTDLSFNRRGAIASLLALSAAGALSACGNAEDAPRRTTVDAELRYARVGQFLGDEEMAFLSAVADTIMPTTDTPGAVEAGVPATIQELASVWGDDAHRRYWRAGLADLSERLGGDFAALDVAEREARLGALDAEVLGGDLDLSFYRDAKATILQAYYMSEPGASVELAYEPVPGEWIGCMPLSDQPKTWAT